MAEVTAMIEDSSAETVLRFENSGLYTEPYDLRPLPLLLAPLTWVLGLYTGSALTATGYISMPVSRFLFVPPNVAAVVTASNGQTRELRKGRYWVSSVHREMKSPPMSVQFVNTKRPSFVQTIKLKSWGQLELEMDLRLTLEVADARLVTGWKDPVGDVKSTLVEAVTKLAAKYDYQDCVRGMPDLLDNEVKPIVAASSGPRGLEVAELMLTRLLADKQFSELARNHMLELKRIETEKEKHEREYEKLAHELRNREAITNKNSEVRRLEAQVEEDVFAIEQPKVARMAIVKINAELREQDYNARLKAIEAVKEVVNELLEARRAHPGHLLLQPDPAMTKALEILEKLGSRTPPIPLGKVNSPYAVDRPSNGGSAAASPLPPPGRS